MIEKTEKMFVFKINEYEENDAIINCICENGSHILLRARGFFKKNSRNILKIKEFTFCFIEYFENSNTKYKNWGLLKTGEVDIDFILETESDLSFKFFISGVLEQNYQSINKNNFNLLLEILKLKNLKLYENELLYLYFLKKNLNFYNINPILNSCSICKKNLNIKSFSLHENGLICKKCFNDKKHNLFLLDDLKNIILFFAIRKFNDLTKINLTFNQEKILKEMILDYYNNELGYKISFI